MPVAPDIDEAGPTKEHRGTAAFWHSALNSPNPMIPTCRGEGVDEDGLFGLFLHGDDYQDIGIRLVSTTTDGDLSVPDFQQPPIQQSLMAHLWCIRRRSRTQDQHKDNNNSNLVGTVYSRCLRSGSFTCSRPYYCLCDRSREALVPKRKRTVLSG